MMTSQLRLQHPVELVVNDYAILLQLHIVGANIQIEIRNRPHFINEVVTNCDNLVVNEETFSQSDIEKMIITIRGVQVMIDRDLARVYKVTTSQLNQQVKRNIARFPANFRFQLTTEEMNNLKSQFVTSSWGGTRKLPYAFTDNVRQAC